MLNPKKNGLFWRLERLGGGGGGGYDDPLQILAVDVHKFDLRRYAILQSKRHETVGRCLCIKKLSQKLLRGATIPRHLFRVKVGVSVD